MSCLNVKMSIAAADAKTAGDQIVETAFDQVLAQSGAADCMRLAAAMFMECGAVIVAGAGMPTLRKLFATLEEANTELDEADSRKGMH